MSYHLAQLNIAKMIAPLDDPRMAGFVAALQPINALAEASPGFVWRLQDEAGDATAIRAFADPDVLVNLSVWESFEALREFVYGNDHRELLKARTQWFHKSETPHLVLWWIPAGHTPGLAEAKEKLALLQAQGSGEQAFDFRHAIAAPG